MLILSNALTDVVDEGCVKVANSLVKRMKKAAPGTYVLAFERQSELADEYVRANKLLLTGELIKKVRKHRGNVLYIPFPAKPRSTALRIFILSFYAGKNLKVMLSMTTQIDALSRLLLKMSRARFVVFSGRSLELYSHAVGQKRVEYLKAGVDVEKFTPVVADRAKELKQYYGFDPDKKLVLHVGHLNTGRNVQQLMKLSGNYQTLLVTSTQTKSEQDLQLKEELLSAGVKMIDSYLPQIQQIYQMADVYFFPVVEKGRCIDVPLSCMEAAACNKPVVTTDFGEMKELVGQKGFYWIDSFEPEDLNAIIRRAVDDHEACTREAVLEYDWKNAVHRLINQ